MGNDAASLETYRITLLAENQPDYRFRDYRTDYGYKDFSKSLAKCLGHFAGFFLAFSHNLTPLNKDFTSEQRS